MLSTLITVLVLSVMLSIIVGFVVSAVRLHRRQKRTLQAQAQTSALVIPPALAALAVTLFWRACDTRSVILLRAS